MNLLTDKSSERTFVAILMALWVAITPLVDVTHDPATNKWFSVSELGLCKVDCDTSEHKNTNLRHDCCHARMRDFTLIEIGGGLFSDSADKAHVYSQKALTSKAL